MLQAKGGELRKIFVGKPSPSPLIRKKIVLKGTKTASTSVLKIVDLYHLSP